MFAPLALALEGASVELRPTLSALRTWSRLGASRLRAMQERASARG
ncbi:Protein of unknown function [Gryllus bimaculatus]|nr:Protein of unknown function [Gryllus bimaculatus]